MIVIQRDFSPKKNLAKFPSLLDSSSTKDRHNPTSCSREERYSGEAEIRPTDGRLSFFFLRWTNEERTREGGRDGCWPPKACFNSLIRRERQGAENNRAFSRGTFQSSSSARRVVPFSIGGKREREKGGRVGRFEGRRILKKSSRFVAFPSPIDVVVGVALRCPFLSFLFSFPRDPCIRAPLPPLYNSMLLLLLILLFSLSLCLFLLLSPVPDSLGEWATSLSYALSLRSHNAIQPEIWMCFSN